mmetsp:Transcript_128919/g.412858  ORF Transcript_128919/g.412858 Transcript_128919/m.412858 type:complete len:173 (-) Transcript_128919:102-620(-)
MRAFVAPLEWNLEAHVRADVGVWTRGQLRLRQNRPLLATSTVRDMYATSPLDVRWTSSWASKQFPLTLRSIFERYAARNETVHLESVVPPVWDYTPKDYFRIEAVFEVVKQPVYYVPAALEVLKYAWIQFLSFLIPTWIVLQSVKTFAFDHQLVETYVVAHLPARGESSAAS